MGIATSIRTLPVTLCSIVWVFAMTPLWVSAQEAQALARPNVNEVTTGTLFYTNQNMSIPAPILDTSVHIDISGIVSKVTFEQTFENTSNDWVEGLYTFPLPDEAAVHSLVVKVGERTIVGKVREKQQAARLYEKAKNEGQVASLVEQQKPNLFSSKIANIAPQESVSITLEYIQTTVQNDSKYGLRIPLTLTPRYQGAYAPSSGSVSAVQPAVFAALDAHNGIDSTSHQVKITGRVHGEHSANTLVSPSHSLSIVRSEKATEFEITKGARLDRDFILQWTNGLETTPAISAWRETVNGHDYVLASIDPPTHAAGIPERTRELIIVIDTSGSMAGESIEAAKSALLDALLGLRPNDTFNIIEFNSSYTAIFRDPLPASPDNLDAARRFTQRLLADGGTEMMPALQHAMSYAQTDSLRQIVFITDGAVGFEENVMQFVTQRLRGARLFTVGIGSAPNQWFMRKVAEAGRGTASFISDVTQVNAEMARLLKVLETPAMTDLAVVFDDTDVDFTPNPLPDLYAGSPVVVAAKLGPNTNTLKANGRWGDETWSREIDVKTIPVVNTGLSKVWARRKIESLEDQQRHHRDPEFFRSIITSVALEHQLLSRFTSFIALEETIVRSPEDALKSAVIPNALPVGSQFESVAFPQGGAGTDTYALISAILALLSGLLWRRQRRSTRIDSDV